jgi:hypothetical protein
MKVMYPVLPVMAAESNASFGFLNKNNNVCVYAFYITAASFHNHSSSFAFFIEEYQVLQKLIWQNYKIQLCLSCPY